MILVLTGGLSYGQQGFHLAPGETVIAVDGVPIRATDRRAHGKPIPVVAAATAPVAAARHSPPAHAALAHAHPHRSNTPPAVTQTSRSGAPPIIGQGTAAYQHALREAQIIASRGGDYHRRSDGGHPLGNAPGCSRSGTGYTWDRNRPGHCWENELPDSRIVARARA